MSEVTGTQSATHAGITDFDVLALIVIQDRTPASSRCLDPEIDDASKLATESSALTRGLPVFKPKTAGVGN